jgi:nickel-dependent lactate racemase
VVITVPDATRSLDVQTALSALSDWLSSASVTGVIVGLGLHRPLSKAELFELSGETEWEVLNHDPDSCSLIGTVRGVPIHINPKLLAARTIITVGKIELHQYAGFSGGYKGQ